MRNDKYKITSNMIIKYILFYSATDFLKIVNMKMTAK
jgi:hypothetical protein